MFGRDGSVYECTKNEGPTITGGWSGPTIVETMNTRLRRQNSRTIYINKDKTLTLFSAAKKYAIRAALLLTRTLNKSKC